ncbi:MAG: hypothetical protein OEY66_06230 [Gammaproteobacteria bacterium]|nr:hypothetical protein [Gammaproteobacteria bacterium]
MEEDEYKATYQEIAKNRCVFEKALTNNQCKCRFSEHFWLADREGYACKSKEIANDCRYLLEKLRENSRFVLKVHVVGEQLPHNADIRVQIGGLRGLRAVLNSDDQKLHGDTLIDDIHALIETAQKQYDNMNTLPYSEIVKSIASYQARKHGKGKQSRDTD